MQSLYNPWVQCDIIDERKIGKFWILCVVLFLNWNSHTDFCTFQSLWYHQKTTTLNVTPAQLHMIVALLPELWLYILSYVVFHYAESEMT